MDSFEEKVNSRFWEIKREEFNRKVEAEAQFKYKKDTIDNAIKYKSFVTLLSFTDFEYTDIILSVLENDDVETFKSLFLMYNSGDKPFLKIKPLCDVPKSYLSLDVSIRNKYYNGDYENKVNVKLKEIYDDKLNTMIQNNIKKDKNMKMLATKEYNNKNVEMLRLYSNSGNKYATKLLSKL